MIFDYWTDVKIDWKKHPSKLDRSRAKKVLKLFFRVFIFSRFKIFWWMGIRFDGDWLIKRQKVFLIFTEKIQKWG